MTNEAMLEAQLDMSLDDLIAQGSKLNKPGRGGKPGTKPDRGRKGGRNSRGGKGTDSMDIDEQAPKELKITIQNNLKPQGGVSKKTAPARPKQPFKNAAKAVKDEKPRPRVDLDSMPWSHDMFKLEGPSKPRMMNPSRHGRGRLSGGGSADRADRQRSEVPGKRTKLMISNLADEVDNQDIQELFSRIGPLKSAQVTYDRTDRPTGFAEGLCRKVVSHNPIQSPYIAMEGDLTGTALRQAALSSTTRAFAIMHCSLSVCQAKVVYNTEEHAKAAYEAYHGVALDGLKMSIKIVSEKSRSDGTFRLSSGIEVSDQRAPRSHATQPRGRGAAGRLKSSARALDADMDAD